MFLIITSSLSVESAGLIVDFAFNLKVNMLLPFNSGNEKKMAKTVRHRLAEHLKKRKKIFRTIWNGGQKEVYLSRTNRHGQHGYKYRRSSIKEPVYCSLSELLFNACFSPSFISLGKGSSDTCQCCAVMAATVCGGGREGEGRQGSTPHAVLLEKTGEISRFPPGLVEKKSV